MSKPNPQVPQQPPQNAPNGLSTPAPNRNLPPADMADLYSEDIGKGISYRTEDSKLPRLTVGQSNSPFVDRHDAAYVAGAEPGCFAIPDLQKVFDGVAGVDVVPVFISPPVWVEWYPSRGGYAGRHVERPADVVTTITQDGNRSKTILTRKSTGNTVEEGRDVFGLLGGELVWFPCKSTFIAFAREWMTFARQFRDSKGQSLPLFARTYKLTTVSKSNTAGRWFKPKFQDLGYTLRDEYLAARQFYADIARGALRVDFSGDRPE
jgi:hypothetical protein